MRVMHKYKQSEPSQNGSGNDASTVQGNKRTSQLCSLYSFKNLAMMKWRKWQLKKQLKLPNRVEMVHV